MRKLPIPVDNSESYILVRGPSSELKHNRLIVARFLNLDIRRSLCTFNEIGIEYIELVSLYDFWRGIVRAGEK